MLTTPIINCGRIFPSENPRLFSMFSVRAEILLDFKTQLIIAKRWQTYMKIIPSDRIEIISPLSKTEVEKRLRENIQPKRGIKLRLTRPKNQKAFEGSLFGNSFQIQRVINGKNSFLPQIKGTINESAHGTKILMDLKIQGFVIGFLALWLGGIGVVMVGTIYGIVTQGTNPLFVIAPLIMFAFGIGLAYFGFNSEKEKSISEMERIVDGRARNNTFANTVYN